MQLLSDFLTALLATGQVSVAGQLAPFAAADRAAAANLLRDYHAADALEAAGPAPAFAPAAAGWAAEFLYRTMQLAFLRDYDESAIAEHLPDWPLTQEEEPLKAEVIFSVDLLFRYLPTLLDLARGLAPADPLVGRLRAVARRWPLSFVGVAEVPAAAPTEGFAEGLTEVLAHPALRARYFERIIERRDRLRAAPHEVNEGIRETLGNYARLLWPEFEPSAEPNEPAARPAQPNET